ncbi:hypothetical protein PG984_007071 [Apiospora sp. TS-2023a]
MPRDVQIKREGSDPKIKREDSDREIKREVSESPAASAYIKKEDEDEKKPLRRAIRRLTSRSSNHSASDDDDEVAIKQEGQPAKRGTRMDGTQAPVEYNWDEGVEKAHRHARSLGIVQIAPVDVGRVVDSGRLIGLYDLDKVRAAESFIVYDNLVVLSRVQTIAMHSAVYELAAHHIGRHLGLSHPHDYSHNVDSILMSDELGGGYALKISPKEPVRRIRRA